MGTKQWTDQLKTKVQCKSVRRLTFVIFFVILFNANTRVDADALIRIGIAELCQEQNICDLLSNNLVSHKRQIRFLADDFALIEFNQRLNLPKLKNQLKQLTLSKSDQRKLVQNLVNLLNEKSRVPYHNALQKLRSSNKIVYFKFIPISNGVLIKYRPQFKDDIKTMMGLSSSPANPNATFDLSMTINSTLNQHEVPHDNSHAHKQIAFTAQSLKHHNRPTIALVDSGISNKHQELSHLKGLQQYNPKDESFELKDSGFGHGTGVFSLMAASNKFERDISTLPTANYLSCNGLPSGSYNYTWVTLCFNWLLQQPRVDVIVNSWSQSTSNCNDELLYSLRVLWLANSIPVFAAGNFGLEDRQSRDPVNFALFDDIPLLSVGALGKNSKPLPQSSAGYNVCDNDVSTPTVVAPGEELLVASPLNPASYQARSGTSYAVTYAATALAILVNRFPATSHKDIVAALTNNSHKPSNDNMATIININSAIQRLEQAQIVDSEN